MTGDPVVDWFLRGALVIGKVGLFCLGLIAAWIVVSFVWNLVFPWVRVGWLLAFKLFGKWFDWLWNLTEHSKRLAERFEKWAKL